MGEYRKMSELYQYTSVRWLYLGCICIIYCIGYYTFDNPQPMQQQLMQKMNLSEVQYNLLYSIYGFPNMIVPFYNGVIIKYIGGIRKCFLVSLLLPLIGQGVCTYGVYESNYILMVLGRGIYGLGSEISYVNTRVFIFEWFINQEITVASTIAISFGGIGYILNSQITTKIYQATQSIVMPFFFCFILQCFACLSGIILVWLHFKNSQKIEEQPETNITKCTEEYTQYNKLRVILIIFAVLGYSTYQTMQNFSNSFLQLRFGYSLPEASNIMSIYYILVALLPILFGYIYDKKGKRITIQIFTYILLALGFLILSILKNSQNGNNLALIQFVFLATFQGCSCAFVWPGLAIITDPNQINKIYSFACSFYNIGSSLVPLVVGYIHDQMQFIDGKFGYFYVTLLLMTMSISGIILMFYFRYEDNKVNKRVENYIVQKREDYQTKE